MEQSVVVHATIALAVGFLLGSISPASLIARGRGIDLTKFGSGNPGATNAGRIMGVRTGILVGALDVLKGFIPAFGFASLWGIHYGELAGLAAVAGHVVSPFLKGRGGKGVSTSAGAVLGTHPLWMVPVLIAFLVAARLGHSTAFGSVVGATTLIVLVAMLGLTGAISLGSVAFGLVIGVLILLRHRSNFAGRFGRRSSTVA